MKVGPDVFCVRPEGKSVEVEVSSIVVLALEGMSNTQVDPYSHVIWSDIQSAVVKLDGLVSSA